ncbi:FtsX-like permease family protein, partial [Phytoactinopolyspora endophytica]|uniref:FtsX-like permease family protein n=1 Tax=Phytoactinopolyspora endophytica TaxID=1642495 RepID=UPI00197B64E9
VGAVALPVFVLAATVGRLSAQLRDRRLANLRLLGLSAAQTRTVAAAEAGLVAAAGTALGVVLSFALRPLLASVSVAGEAWTMSDLSPPLLAWAVVVVGMPAVTTAIAVLPQQLDMRHALERARKADARRPSAWRAAPLAVGIALCLLARRANDDFMVSSTEVAIVFAGLGLVGIGIVMIVPVFVRLLADLLSRVATGPTATLTARRLQAQPAGTTRVIAALMVGLFLVVGARSVIVAFEETPQYVGAADHIENGQRASVAVPTDQLDDTRQQIDAIPGVYDTFAFPVLTGTVELPTGTTGHETLSITALVASCDQLRQFAPAITSCSDDEASALVPQWVHDDVSPDTATLRAVNAEEQTGDPIEVGNPIEVAISDR